MTRKSILFVCEKNTCRSQMAEGFCKSRASDRLNAFSAGIRPGPIDPLAILVMREIGIDISGQENHAVADFADHRLDYVVTVCNTAAAKCPEFAASISVICQHFDDPPSLARPLELLTRKLVIYRRVRDEIGRFIDGFIADLDP